MKKILAISCIAASALLATDIMPYAAYLNYNNSVKDKGYLAGIYASTVKSPYKIEIDAEHTSLTYKDTIPDYDQTDLTLMGHYYYGYNYDFKLGIHNIFVNQTDNPEKYDKVFMGGILYYKTLQYNAGADFYYGVYKGFHVAQVSPKAGYNFGNYNSSDGSFYAQAQLNHIGISQADIANKTSYTDVDMKLQNFKGPWTTTLKATLGKSAYKVANGGFTVYNLGEEYKNSFGLDIQYAFTKIENLKVGFSRATFVNNVGDDASSNVYTVSYFRAF